MPLVAAPPERSRLQREPDLPVPAARASTTQAEHIFRFAGMDGIRALTACGVVLLHVHLATAWTSGNPLELSFDHVNGTLDTVLRQLRFRTNVFFVLSAFLLTLPFARWLLLDGPRPNLRRFAARRVRRIWPLYLFVMPIAAAAVAPHLSSTRELVINALFLQHAATGSTSLLAQTWILPIEVGFYALLPVAMIAGALVARRLGSLAARTGALAAMCMGLALAAVAVRSTMPPSRAVEFSVVGYADTFAFGMLAAILVVAAIAGRGELAARVRSMRPLMWTVPGAGAIAAGLYLQHEAASVWHPALIAAGVATWLACIALQPLKSWAARLVQLRPLEWLGTLSYGIFLWHIPIQHALRTSGLHAGGSELAIAQNFLMVMALTVPVAWLSWHLIEQPFMDGRITLPRPQLPRLWNAPAPKPHPAGALTKQTPRGRNLIDPRVLDEAHERWVDHIKA